MLTDYIQAAMQRATCEILPDNEGYYGEIPHIQGMYTNADPLEECREELQSMLEGWMALGLILELPFPDIDVHTLDVQKPEIQRFQAEIQRIFEDYTKAAKLMSSVREFASTVSIYLSMVVRTNVTVLYVL